MMHEYRATFLRAGGDTRHPTFSTDETDPEKLAATARQRLHAIPFLKRDGWELVNIKLVEPTKYEDSEAGITALADTLISRIRVGEYLPDSKFPTIIQICGKLNVSERVATLALARLKTRNYLRTVGRGSARRYYVQPRHRWRP